MALRVWLVVVRAASCDACRFMAYVGEEAVDGRAFLLESEHNLLSMATDEPLVPAAKLSPRFNATQFALRNAEKNLDGYGISWYEADEPFPRRVRSAQPVVGHDGAADETLTSLLRGDAVPTLFRASLDSCVETPLAPPRVRLASRALFAHVRAASAVDAAPEERNSHPFAFQTLTWMHNGGIAYFDRTFRKDLEASLRPTVRSLVSGQTDSELAGAVFVDHLAGFPHRRTYDLVALRAAMLACIATIRERTRAAREKDEATPGACASTPPSSSLNFAVTDGESLVVVRYRSHPDEDPPTLYYRDTGGGVFVSSEPDSKDPAKLKDWVLLGKNRMLSYAPGAGVHLECVDHLECDDEMPASAALELAGEL